MRTDAVKAVCSVCMDSLPSHVTCHALHCHESTQMPVPHLMMAKAVL